MSFYPHRSKARAILIHERAKRLRAENDPLGEVFQRDQLTRIEVQFRGKGVPIRRFRDIRAYAEVDLLKDVAFLKMLRLRKGLKPRQTLEAQGMRALIEQYGLQIASKAFTPPEWAYLAKKYFEPLPHSMDSYIRTQMRRSANDWLQDRIRFPRGRRRETGAHK
jgi:hypothetical protein